MSVDRFMHSLMDTWHDKVLKLLSLLQTHICACEVTSITLTVHAKEKNHINTYTFYFARFAMLYVWSSNDTRGCLHYRISSLFNMGVPDYKSFLYLSKIIQQHDYDARTWLKI